MDPQHPAPRGRARGRARSIEGQPEAQERRLEEPQIFGDPRVIGEPGGGSSSGSGSGGSPQNGGNGDGSSNGSPNGNGRGGSPRGMSPRPADNSDKERERYLDYVRSRPGPGFDKKGTSQHRSQPRPRIVANYYGFQMRPVFTMMVYAVTVEPQEDNQRIIRAVMATQKTRIGSYLLTGLQLFVTKPVPEDLLTFVAATQRNPEKLYTIQLAFVRDVDPAEATVFQFYNTVVRSMQYMMKFKLLGRHFFNPDQRQPFPSWRLELWPGFQNSIRQQEDGLMMNVEGVWKVLQTTNILTMMQNIRRENEHDFQGACQRAIVGMTVITRYGNDWNGTRAYKVSRIDFAANCNSTFETRSPAGPVQKSYVDYYQQKYNVAIGIPTQPMLVSEPRMRDVRRGQTGDIYLVPELCYPCGLNEELRSNFRLMKDLAVCLHQPPAERVDQMQNFVRALRANADIHNTLVSWGMKLNENPIEFEARTLNPEDIIMGGERRVSPDDKADWTNAFRSHQMLGAAKLTTWAVIVTGRDRQGVPNLVGTMRRVGGPLGYQIAEPQVFQAGEVRQFPERIGEAMAKSQGKLDLCFIILPSNNADSYAAVKKRCSVEYGIPSQCFLSKNLQAKGLMSICTKMVIQMNAKQGGEPWGIANPLKSVMIAGYDVHHAGPTGGSSISAMCATMNPTLGKYFSLVRQTPSAREEVATCVAGMFERCLVAYVKKNGGLPDRMFFYRDGVGEGQLLDVFEHEVQAIQDRITALCEQMKPAARPKLTYIVVNKRINTRFFQRMHNGFRNPMPGLVVDDHVTRPERYDFFLVSQTARQGCVSPTYYNVLKDENGLPPDRLQMYTYKMCHLYYNWSGTVAVPAPCQNAHKLALQVGTALKRPAHDNLSYLLHFL